MKKKTINYIDNKELLQHLIEYKAKCREAKERGEPKPRIPEYIGHCILLIATKLNSSGRFYGYSYKDDMIADGIENCVRYIGNFDTERFSNPLAYLTQICWNGSVKRILTEKKQQEIKSQIVKNSGILEMMQDSFQHGDCDSNNYDNTYLKFLLEMEDQKTEKEVKPRGKPGRKPKPKKSEIIKQEDRLNFLSDDNDITDIIEEDEEVLKDYFAEIEEE